MFTFCMCLLIEKLKDINAGEWGCWGDIKEVSGKIALLPLNASKDFRKCIQLFFCNSNLKRLKYIYYLEDTCRHFGGGLLPA